MVEGSPVPASPPRLAHDNYFPGIKTHFVFFSALEGGPFQSRALGGAASLLEEKGRPRVGVDSRGPCVQEGPRHPEAGSGRGSNRDLQTHSTDPAWGPFGDTSCLGRLHAGIPNPPPQGDGQHSRWAIVEPGRSSPCSSAWGHAAPSAHYGLYGAGLGGTQGMQTPGSPRR